VQSKRFRWSHLAFLFIAGSVYPVLNNIILYFGFPYKYGFTLGFLKPYFISSVVYLGMAILIIPCLIKRYTCPSEKNENDPRGLALFRKLGLPSFLFLISANIQSYALVYMPTTVWQLFHGFQVLFTTLFAVTYRHQRLFLVDWLGLFATVSGICIGGVASMLRGIKNDDVSIYSLFIAFILVIISHGIRSFQTIKEEEITHDLRAEPIEVVACEGIWCLFISLTIVTPLTNIVPSTLGVGLYENTSDSIARIALSYKLPFFLLGLLVSSTIYYYCGVVVTSFSSAIHRNLYEMVRPFLVWTLSTITYYVTGNTLAGEKLDGYTAIELIGFAVSVVGTLIYNRYIKLPCFVYNELIDAETDDHSISRNLIQ
jgi:drug/metabolite transporter (DMT)-like permease